LFRLWNELYWIIKSNFNNKAGLLSSKWFLRKLGFWLSWKIAKMLLLHYNNQAAKCVFGKQHTPILDSASVKIEPMILRKHLQILATTLPVHDIPWKMKFGKVIVIGSFYLHLKLLCFIPLYHCDPSFIKHRFQITE
jgi:hypothetical protein